VYNNIQNNIHRTWIYIRDTKLLILVNYMLHCYSPIPSNMSRRFSRGMVVFLDHRFVFYLYNVYKCSYIFSIILLLIALQIRFFLQFWRVFFAHYDFQSLPVAICPGDFRVALSFIWNCELFFEIYKFSKKPYSRAYCKDTIWPISLPIRFCTTLEGLLCM
jgi:hypothetical protein